MTLNARTCILSVVFILTASIVGTAQTPGAIERELLRHLADVGKYGNYSGSGDERKRDQANNAIERKLIRYGKRPSFLRYTFPNLKGEMYVATSKDGKFRTFSWDRQSGGTMHDFSTVFQFKGKSGRVYTWLPPEQAEGEFGGFYHQIFQTETPSGRIYLANSTFVASTSLASQQLGLFRIVGEKVDPNVRLIRTGSGLRNSVGFAYDFFSVVDRPDRPIILFFFDETTKSFRFPIVIEDPETPQGRVTNKFITYRFNGNYFVKVK